MLIPIGAALIRGRRLFEPRHLLKEIRYLLKSYEKNWRSQNFDFLCSTSLSPGQFLGSSNSRRYHWILKHLVATEKLEVWEQTCMCLFYYFNFEKSCGVLKSKSPSILLKGNIDFNKNETESKMQNPTHSLRETNVVLQLI